MGAADRPVRQPKLPQLYEAGPASGRIHRQGSWDQQQNSSEELDGSGSPPVSSQLQQAVTLVTPVATVALRPDATQKHRWVIPRGSHDVSPSQCRLELRGPELVGGRQLGTHHWVAEVEGVPDSQEVELHDGTALQLKDGSVWDIVQTPPEPSLAAQRQWLPSPSAHLPWEPGNRQRGEQHPAPHLQQQAINHTSAPAQDWRRQRHIEQHIPGLRTRQDLPEQHQEFLAPNMQQHQQLQSAPERLAAERHSLELDMLTRAMRDAAARTGMKLPKPAAAGPSAAAGQVCTPANTWSSGSPLHEEEYEFWRHCAVRQADLDSSQAAMQLHRDAASRPASGLGQGMVDSRPQTSIKQQRSGSSRRSNSGLNWQQSASQLRQESPEHGPQAASSAQDDQQPNGHAVDGVQLPALSMPAPQQVLSAGKLKIRLPQSAAKGASRAAPSPVRPGNDQQPTHEPLPKRQRVEEPGVAQVPAALPSASTGGSQRIRRQGQQQATGSAIAPLPLSVQPPARQAVPFTAAPAIQSSPASQRSQVQVQLPQPQQPAGADTTQSLPPGLQPAPRSSSGISKAQKAQRAPSKPAHPRQRPTSTERADAITTASGAADADVKPPGAQGLKAPDASPKQQHRQQQRRQGPPGKAKLVEDDFVSQRPASAAKSATAMPKSAAKQQGGTPTGTPGRAAHAEAKAGAKATSIPDAAAGAGAARQRPASSQGRSGSAKLLPVPTPPKRRGHTPAGSAPASPSGEHSADGGVAQPNAATAQSGKQDTPKADAKLQLQCEVEYAKLRKLLGGLSKAKDTINPTSAHIMNAAAAYGCGRKMVQIIVERIAQEPELGRRVGMLYVVDSVLQGSQKSRAADDSAPPCASVFRNTIGAALPSLVDAVAKTREGRLRTVHVLSIWAARDLLPAKVLEPVASKLAADIAADEATPADPTITAMARDRLAPMTFELSGSTGTALRIWLKPEEDEEVGPRAGTPLPLVRAEYAWLSVAKRERAYSESPPPVAPGQDPWEVGPDPWEMGPDARWPTRPSGVDQADMDMASPLQPPPAPVHEVLVSPPRLPWAPRHEPSYTSPVTLDSASQLQGSSGTQPYYSPEVAYSPSRSFEDVLLGRSSDQKAPPPWQHPVPPAVQQPWQQAQQPPANGARLPWPGGAATGPPQHHSQQQPPLQHQPGYQQQQQLSQRPPPPQERLPLPLPQWQPRPAQPQQPPPQERLPLPLSQWRPQPAQPQQPPPQQRLPLPLPQWQPRPAQPQQPPTMQSAIHRVMQAPPPDIAAASAAQLQSSVARPQMHNVHQQPPPPLAQRPPQQHWQQQQQQQQQWRLPLPQQQQWEQPAAAVAFAQAALLKHSAGVPQPPLPEDPPPLPDDDAPPPMPNEAAPAPDVDIMDFPPSPIGDEQPPLPPE